MATFLAGAAAAFFVVRRFTALRAGARFAAFLAGARFFTALRTVRLAALRAGARLVARFAGARFFTAFRTVRFAAFLADTRLTLLVTMACRYAFLHGACPRLIWLPLGSLLHRSSPNCLPD
ncbi:MAG TPA: hypothetical protein VED63_07740 [Acidimicrobiales bacterium]|nr:hypothetical protein [Acidimicrobiales bacterium]